MKILNQNQEVKNISQKTGRLTYVIFFTFFLLFTRLAFLQLIRGESYSRQSRSNFTLTEKIHPPRGDILSSDGKLLATTQPSYKISVVPVFFSRRDNINEQIDRISSVLELSSNEKALFHKRLSACFGRCRYIPMLVKEDIHRDRIVRFSSYLTNFPGVLISSSYKRVYPFGEKTAHVTGYISRISPSEIKIFENYDPENFVGKTALERSYETQLHGEYGEISHVIDHIGRKIEFPEDMVKNFPESVKAEKGSSIVTTIKSYLQETAHRAFGNQSGAAVVIEVSTGRILALYSNPSYDPNLLARRRIPEKIWNEYSKSILRPLTNKAIQQTYYPGSTFKIIPALAALHYGIVTPEKTFYCAGCMILGNETKCCWNRGGHHHVNLRKSIIESCDIYYYNLASEISIERFTHFSSLFHLGRNTGIEIPGEVSGILPDREWLNINHPGIPITRGVMMNMLIGQGDMRMTPLQIAMLYAAFANNGVLMYPKIVKHVTSQNGKVTEITPEVLRVLDIDKNHFKEINRALYGVGNEPGGTAFLHADRTIPHAAGKTGTSQRISLASRKKIDPADDERLNLTLNDALFAAFFPYKDPEIAVAVVVENGEHGGSVAAPIAYKIMRSYHLKKRVE